MTVQASESCRKLLPVKAMGDAARTCWPHKTILE